MIKSGYKTIEIGHTAFIKWSIYNFEEITNNLIYSKDVNSPANSNCVFSSIVNI